jgi:hypothetical protein
MATPILKRALSLFGREGQGPAVATPRKPPNRFHAVTLVGGPKSCAAVRALRDQRFLSREAPTLPLKGCDCTRCECHYEHYEDRRKGGRRARDLGVAIDGYDGADQRTPVKRGRRQIDGK